MKNKILVVVIFLMLLIGYIVIKLPTANANETSTNIADINHDGSVDIYDLFNVTLAFGSYPGHPRWNPNCDLNNDLRIDLKDIWIVARNFGWTMNP